MERFENVILKLIIGVDQVNEVKSEKGVARMILFHGQAASPYFNGIVASGGVDTQIQYTNEKTHLSARYILEGTDQEGTKCKVFIENNGAIDETEMPFITKPVIFTDSSALKWMESTPLKGYVTYEEEQLIIRICKA